MGVFPRRMVLMALTLSAYACVRGEAPRLTGAPLQGVSVDGALAYSVDPDLEVLTVTRRASRKKVAEVKVGKAPEHLLVAPDDTVYVANRGSRSVSVIQRGKWAEPEAIAAGLEPLGLAITSDSRTLYVVNGSSVEKADEGTLMAVSLKSRKVEWVLPVGESPRGISLKHGNLAAITVYKHPAEVIVDLAIPAVIRDERASNGVPSPAYAGAPGSP